ncbi:hypothetical protein [Bradyrhizobium cenepequi]|uniref:hypothetical protein n=1 Tax=Bradyrhizobium cenepequi TaxID=2821403 RepID=UPI001CE33028|nr:hypothetical protein [Bradyrhizobium cenepequi]MCA6108122.1 hypothetical protein [Bradyrhizobium cenepequi]
MRKLVITCDHCFKTLEEGDGHKENVTCTVKAEGEAPTVFGPVDLCVKCFGNSMRAARFAFTAAPPPAVRPAPPSGPVPFPAIGESVKRIDASMSDILEALNRQSVGGTAERGLNYAAGGPVDRAAAAAVGGPSPGYAGSRSGQTPSCSGDVR